MDDNIEIPVTYKGQEYCFKAKLVSFGYIHRIEVNLNDHIVLLEPDEERNYRVITDPSKDQSFSTVEKDLLREIIRVIDSIA